MYPVSYIKFVLQENAMLRNHFQKAAFEINVLYILYDIQIIMSAHPTYLTLLKIDM